MTLSAHGSSVPSNRTELMPAGEGGQDTFNDTSVMVMVPRIQDYYHNQELSRLFGRAVIRSSRAVKVIKGGHQVIKGGQGYQQGTVLSRKQVLYAVRVMLPPMRILMSE
jgi:hypothetical protein